MSKRGRGSYSEMTGEGEEREVGSGFATTRALKPGVSASGSLDGGAVVRDRLVVLELALEVLLLRVEGVAALGADAGLLGDVGVALLAGDGACRERKKAAMRGEVVSPRAAKGGQHEREGTHRTECPCPRD